MQNLVDLEGLAETLDLPKDWLREEYEAGRIPCFEAGGAIRFNPVFVADALAGRATQTRTRREDSDE